ncbi:acyl-thioesterase ii [Apiospora hydei]|uniref:Acyl-thioesterase ii n=1 Tax=Apiospora hydei TaxID=1337664 RepID=A0ABR1WRZ4_9PEZI
MASAATIERRVGVQHPPYVGPNTYANEEPLTSQPTGRAVFGGLLLSQAISAASATVPSDFHVYSSHSHFLRPVAATFKDRVLYHVDRIADGRSYATRVVRATQGDRSACVYIATIAFQNSNSAGAGNVWTTPTDVPADLNRKILADGSSPDSPLQPLSSEVEAFARAAEPLTSTSSAMHMAALAYMSDEMFLAMAIVANPNRVGVRARNVAMGATLSHRIAFHEPAVARVDAWMVSERETSWGGGGRVLLHQRTWDLGTGRLVMTCEQEALIRLKGDEPKL